MKGLSVPKASEWSSTVRWPSSPRAAIARVISSSTSARRSASAALTLKKRAWRPRPSIVATMRDRKSTRLNSSHLVISYAVFCLKKKKNHEVYILDDFKFGHCLAHIDDEFLFVIL